MSDKNEFRFMTLQIFNKGLKVLFVVVNSDTKVMETVCWLGVRSSQWPRNRSKPGAQRINSAIILTNNYCAWKHFKMSPHLGKEVTCMTDHEWFLSTKVLERASWLWLKGGGGASIDTRLKHHNKTPRTKQFKVNVD